MTYITLSYYLFVLAALIIYYIFPLKARWFVLLVANGAFYYYFYKTGWWVFLITILVTYGLGLCIEKLQGKARKAVLCLGIATLIIPWFIVKNGNLLLATFTQARPISFIVPMGISFYTLQLISYLFDINRGQIAAEKNPLKFALFASFFPQIIQGPIPRFAQLSSQLFEGQKFNDKKITKGFCYIIWGFFLKFVIADKAAIIVDTIFNDYQSYTGMYIWLAAALYAVQLYTDFLSCTTLAQGVSLLFGIELMDNFRQPFFAQSISCFWKRWHISLSSWLRDYIYIPLGGNRHGRFLKYIFIMITFGFSGLWHGEGLKYLVWGLANGVYLICGELTNPLREKLYELLKIQKDSRNKKIAKIIMTFIFFCLSLVVFRADNLETAKAMYISMFTTFNPWILFTNEIFTLGLEAKEIVILIFAILILFTTSKVRENGESVAERVMSHVFPVRIVIYSVAIMAILIFGTYGLGFNANDFIYGGF